MRVLEESAIPGQCAAQLVIMLPGALQKPGYFIDAGFAAALRETGAHDWPTWRVLWQNFLRRNLSGASDEMEPLR